MRKDTGNLAMLMAGSPFTPRGAVGSSAKAMARAEDSLASRSASMYNSSVKDARAFAEDYPAARWPEGVPADAAGRLTRDIEGRPLNPDDVIVGRRMVGGLDEPASAAEMAGLAKATTGRDAKAVPRHAIGGDDGRLAVEYTDAGKIKSTRILTAEDLSVDDAVKTAAHELAHRVDMLTKPPANRESFRSMKWGITEGNLDKIEEELYRIYRDLNNPKAAHFGPTDRGYSKAEVGKELWAEAIRAYMANPNYIKTVAPDVAAAIRAAVNPNLRVNKYIQFNVGSPYAAGLMPFLDRQPQPSR